MQKVSPKKNTLDNDFLNVLGSTISNKETDKQEEVRKQSTQTIQEKNEIEENPFLEGEESLEMTEIERETPKPQRALKATQIVVRTTEKEKREIQSYFMKHGLSISKGIKIAIKYLEQQEKKNLVHFSDVGLY